MENNYNQVTLDGLSFIIYEDIFSPLGKQPELCTTQIIQKQQD